MELEENISAKILAFSEGRNLGHPEESTMGGNEEEQKFRQTAFAMLQKVRLPLGAFES